MDKETTRLVIGVREWCLAQAIDMAKSEVIQAEGIGEQASQLEKYILYKIPDVELVEISEDSK